MATSPSSSPCARLDMSCPSVPRRDSGGFEPDVNSLVPSSISFPVGSPLPCSVRVGRPGGSSSACLGRLSPTGSDSSGRFDPAEASSDPSSRSIPPFGPVLDPGALHPSSSLSLEDPVARDLAYPGSVVLADAARSEKFAADWEICLPPTSRTSPSPVSGEGLSLPGGVSDGAKVSCLRPYHDPPLYPVHPLCDKPSVSRGSPASFQISLESSKESFPPLPKSGSSSISLRPSSSPAADSSVPLPAILPCQDPILSSAPGDAKASWASLLLDNPAVMELSYFKPTVQLIDGRLRCSLPPEVAINGATAWEPTIVGFFLDKLPYSLVNSLAHRMWDAKGLSEVLSNDNGFFFFKFRDKTMCLDILNGGPWYFGGRPIFLKGWKPGMNLSKEGCKRVPIWALFRNIPLEHKT